MEPVNMEKIRSNLYRVEVPLPGNPLKATNSYIIESGERNLVIDTGMNRQVCLDALREAFAILALDPQRTDYFITHMHADHIGLVDELPAADSKIYFNAADAAILANATLWQTLAKLSERHGFPRDLVDKTIGSHPAQRYSPRRVEGFTMVEEGDCLSYGGYELQCLVTPGHTMGHTCLFEPRLRFLFSGDHILGDITPNISSWREESNNLQFFLHSLDRAERIGADLILPGHRSLVREPGKRIAELREHHRIRLEEAERALRERGGATAFVVASQMTWDLVADGWNDFPLMQQWFATGEALAHLRYLEEAGRIKSEDRNGVVWFLSG